MNIIPQDQTEHEPIRFISPIPPWPNQAILVTPAISVSTIPYSSQYFMNNPTVNNPILSSKLTALETKLGGEMVVITSYFMNEMQ